MEYPKRMDDPWTYNLRLQLLSLLTQEKCGCAYETEWRGKHKVLIMRRYFIPTLNFICKKSHNTEVINVWQIDYLHKTQGIF